MGVNPVCPVLFGDRDFVSEGFSRRDTTSGERVRGSIGRREIKGDLPLGDTDGTVEIAHVPEEHAVVMQAGRFIEAIECMDSERIVAGHFDG